MIMDTPAHSRVIRVIHWITILLIATMIPTAFVMEDVEPGALQNALYNFHRSAGITILALTLLRLVVRLIDPPAPLPASVTAFQALTAHGVHALLYLTLLVNPLVGWAATSAFGAKISVFGLFTMPALIERDRELARSLFDVHEILGTAMLVLLGLHVLGALYHQFISRDAVFKRIVTG
ncbi:MAG: cytochrome b [Pseudomonadota bacterium]